MIKLDFLGRPNCQVTAQRAGLIKSIALILTLSSLPAIADEDTDFLLKGNWSMLSKLDDPATRADIESNSVRRDQYPEVSFSLRYVLLGSESERGLQSNYGRYNVKVVKMALNCQEKEIVIYQNLYWFADYTAKTMTFKGKDWGTSTWRPLDESSFFWKVLPAICQR